MSNDNRRKLYDALSQDYDMGTYEQFCKDIQDETKRKKLYDATSEVYDYGDYIKFSSQLGFGKISPDASSTSTPDQATEVQPSTEKKQEGWKPTPMQKAFMMGEIQSGLDDFAASSKRMVERSGNQLKYNTRRESVVRSAAKGDIRVNADTGKIEQTYITPGGTATADKFAAERETRAYNEYVDNMTVSGQLRRAGRDLSDLHRKREGRVKAIHDKWAADQEKNTAPLAAVLGAQTYVPSIQSDPEYRALTAAIHQAEKRVQTLQHESDRQDGKDVGYWRGFGEVVGDIKTWDFGYSGLMDAMTMLDATSKPSPNRPVKTDAQKEAEQIMLEQTYEAQQAQSAYGQNDSFWNRAGVMTGEMLPFMLDFAIMGGAKGGTSMVTRNLDAILLRSLHKAAPKVARNKAVQWTTKALGAMPEDLLYRAPLMTNTVQGMKTSADIIDRKLGDVVVRDDGTYDFSNDKTWGSAIWQGEANAIIENYSEMFGTHLEGVLSLNTLGKIADTFGAKRLSGILTKAGNSELAGIAGTMQKHLNQLGVSDYLGEVGEEYYGQLWRTMLNLDDAYTTGPDGKRKNLFLDGQFHGDIWGGMALSMGLLGAGKYSISAAAYGSMKHRVNKTDARASEIFTPEVWDGWRERIDGTTNDKIGEMADAIVADPTLTDEQRSAAMNYMEASLNLRGFNLASVAHQRGGEMSEDEVAANESYMDGYSASTPQEMNDAKRMLDMQHQRLASALSEDLVQDFDNDPIGALSNTHEPELRIIAADYVNAKMVYDGMIQRVRDDVDGRIAQSDAMIKSRINQETGMVQPATYGSDKRKVYIVNGTVAMYEDGTGVDAQNSSESIIIRDAESGKVEFADPTQFLSIDEAIDAETEKEAARKQIIDEIAVPADNNIDGVLSFTPGDSYSILDAEGNQQSVSVLGQTADENGMPIDGYVDIQFPDGSVESVATSDVQEWADAANTQRVEQFDQERSMQRDAEAEAARQADQSGLSNPNRRTDLMPDDYKMPYDNRPVRASQYIESKNGTGGTLYQDENGNDAVVIAAIDDNNYVGYFREYDEQGNPTNRWSAKFQNGSGIRENHRDMMLTAQELLPAGHELTEHTSVSTDGLRNLANQLKHGYELQYDEQGNIVTTEVAVNMMARENELGLSDYKPGSIDPARVTSEEYKGAAARLIPYMEALGLSKFNIHWEDGTLYVDHPILKRADTPQQEAEPTVTGNAETVPNSAENTEIPTENRDLGTESVPQTDIPVENVQQTADDGFIPIDPNIKPDENGEINIPSPGTNEVDDMLAPEEPKPTALSQIPTDEKGDPIYEQADPGTAWDALLEETEDEQIAQNVIAQEIAEREDALKKLEKQKPKAGLSTREKIQAEKDKKKAMDGIRQSIDHWKRMSETRERRQAEEDAIRNAEISKRAEEARVKAEQERAEREEAERIEREALDGVPDWSRDTPQDARARGYRRNGPQKVDRQNDVTAIQGKEVEVRFGENELPKGHAAIIDATELQPSHLQGGRNPLHFLDEAQPKERDDAASVLSAKKIASNIRPEEITSSVTAYTGAPTVNLRGETIQGNSRSDALRLMYESNPEQAAGYRQYLIDHAADYGLTPEQIASVERPVLVNMLDVTDDEAIRLGQFVAQDTESGGIERIKPKNAVQKMGNKIRNFANILLRSEDDEASLSQLIEANGTETIKWMSRNGFITDTQYGSAFDSNGELSAKASEDLKGILYQNIFTGGSTRLEEMFNKLPAKAQRAILSTAFRDYDSNRADRMGEELQQSIISFYDLSSFEAFANATNLKDALAAVEAWKHQYAMDDVTGESYLPAENFSNFALKLAAIYKGGTQKFIRQTFNDLFDAIQGTAQDTLFEEADKTPKSLAEAIRKVLDLEYQPVKQKDNGHNGSDAVDIHTPQSEAGRSGSRGNAESREREQDSAEPADSGAGTSQDSGERGDVAPIGKGRFGNIFAAFRGKAREAWLYLSKLKSGQAKGVFYRPEIGEIDLVWGEAPTPYSGKGLAHIDRKHVKTLGDFASMEEAIRIIDDVVKNGTFTEQDARTVVFDKGIYRVVVARDDAGNWVLTAFDNKTPAKEKKKRKDAATRGTAGQPNAEARAVAPDLSVGKDNTSPSYKQAGGNEKHSGLDSAEEEEAAIEAEEEALRSRIEVKDDDWAEGNGYTPTLRRTVVIDGKHSVTQVDAPDEKGDYTGSVFEYDGKTFGDLREVISHIDNSRPATIGEKITEAEAEVNTNPTDRQKEAGNYRKGHVQVGTFDVTIENPKGSKRSGIDADGKKWESTMTHTYGYICGTKSVDGDHIDVFISSDVDGWDGRKVFVVDQYNPDGSFDEHKVMLGFNDRDEAFEGYLSNYEAGWENGRRLNVTAVNLEDFEKWIDSSRRKTKPFADYKSVKAETSSGYSIEPRKDTRDNSDIFAVKFEERVSREVFKGQKATAKKHGGYWSNFGKKGFLFKTREEAETFANEVMGKDKPQLSEEAPLSIDDMESAIKPTTEETTAEKTENSSPSEETPLTHERWVGMDGSARLAESSRDLLTREEIDNCGVDDVIKTNAIAFINGKRGFVAECSYLKAYEDVRFTNRDSSGDSGRENITQLAGTDNVGGDRREDGGGDGRVSEPLDRGHIRRDVSGEKSDRTHSEGVSDSYTGKKGDSILSEPSSGMEGYDSGSVGRKRGGYDRSPRSNGGSGRRAGSKHDFGDDGRGATQTGHEEPGKKSERDNDIDSFLKDAVDGFNSLLDDFNRRGLEGLSISITGMSARQLELLPKLITAGAKVGYALLRKGMTVFSEWRRNMLDLLGTQLKKAGLNDSEIEEWINEMWNCDYTVDGITRKVSDWAAVLGQDRLRATVGKTLADKRKAQQEAESIEVRRGDMENIRETLPFLLPQQQDDVLKAERQFFDDSHKDHEHAYGKGYMFTNGTGTGKTYTGLGIVKRFVKQGMGRVLILTPSQTKVKDWINDASNLSLELQSLDDVAKKDGKTATTVKGSGAVITTYANFRQNQTLLEDEFDLIVYDESHRLLENKKGEASIGSMQHYMLSNRNENYAFERLRRINPVSQELERQQKEFQEEYDFIVEKAKNEGRTDNIFHLKANGKIPPFASEQWNMGDETRFPKLAERLKSIKALRKQYEEVEKPKIEKAAKEAVSKTKVVFLSATPFNTRDNLDYAEGYIFSYPKDDNGRQSPRSRFFLEHFGSAYKYRYNRLENSATNPQAVTRQEIAFSDYLQDTLQTMSGRVIDSQWDYSRDFPTVTGEYAQRFNEAMEELQRDESTRGGMWAVMRDHNYTSALFESLKVSQIIPRLKSHIAMGRKVVVFHRRVETHNPLALPFRSIFDSSLAMAKETMDSEKRKAMLAGIRRLERKYADMLEWERTLDLRMPREQLADAFGKESVLFFSGKETSKNKNKAVEEFNDDNSGKNLIVIQEASGKEGISLHDRTGVHQRVLVTLALPQSPITALQIEGRIFRIGNRSNAIFEYPLLGLNTEMTLFGQSFNSQVGTTENLALGSKARNLRESFARGVEEHSGDVDLARQGTGGKEFDASGNDEVDEFDRAVLDYYSNQKLNGRRDSREGKDYYPTPEPLGYVMARWGRIDDGESVLEPSAGHGAIARYVPFGAQLTAVEPSSALFSRLQLKAGGIGRKFENDIFENYHIVNKHDVVLMNPPFGTAGKLAVDHVAKAFCHLEEGGRVVALIPRGSTDKKFEKWYNETKTATIVGEVQLPDITFERAGTSVRCRVVVLDKISNSKLAQKASADAVRVDLSGEYAKIEDFFDDLRNIEMPQRTIDIKSIVRKKCAVAARDIREISGVTDVHVEDGRMTIKGRRYLWGASLNWDDLKGKELKDSLLGQFKRFSERYDSAVERDDALEAAVFDELRMLSAKLAGVTVDEAERQSGNIEAKDDGSIRYRLDDNIDNLVSGIEKVSQEVNRTITDYISSYPSAPISIIDNISDIDTEDLTQEDRELLKDFISNDTAGDAFYYSGNGKIYIFANRFAEELWPDVLHHENTHGVIGKWREREGESVDLFLDEFRANLVKSGAYGNGFSKLEEILSEEYGPEEVSEEFMTYTLGEVFKGHIPLKFIEDFLEPERYEILKDNIIDKLYGKDKAGQMRISSGHSKESVGYIQREGETGGKSSGQGRESGELNRDGDGAYSDAEVSMENDPWSRAWGESLRTKRRQKEFAERERERMRERAKSLSSVLGVDIEILDRASGDGPQHGDGRKQRAKGWYDIKTGKITVVVSNHSSVSDMEATILHEAVAHHGLRQLLGEHFDEFLDKVYEAAGNGIKEQIDLLASRNGWNRRVATEEYLAGLAERTDFDRAEERIGGWFDKIKRFFIDMLIKAGFRHIKPGTIGDNELRYILWRSYQNLAHPGRYRAFEWEAEDVAMQYELHVGEYSESPVDKPADAVAEAGELYELNERFNRDLSVLTEGNADRISLDLGFPSRIARAGGVSAKRMKLYGNKVIKKMKKHGFKLSELRNLPEAVAHPIAVFNNLGRKGNRSILTELETEQGNFLVTVDLGKGGGDVDFNIISSVFGKGKEKVIGWIEKGYLTSVDKEKALSYLHYPAPIAETLSSSRLDSTAKIVENFENPTIDEQNNNANDGILFRDGDFTPRDRAIAVQQYERMLSRGSWQFREATQDSMLGLKSLYESILGSNIRIENVAGYENAYLYENRMSSANNGEQHQYFSRFMKPLLEGIHKLCGSKELDRRILTDYMIAKHGLERNEYMRKEAAANGEDTERDFAGLCGLTGEDDWQVAETVARQMVNDYETEHDTAELWDNVKKATNATLEKIYLSGLISEDTYNKVLGMYDFYIPLRGWDETTSDEVYGYLTSKDGPLMGSVFKSAEGRESKADDPIATIAMMADDAIRQGNRNIMKQRFLNFVHGNPSDLVSINEMWLQHNDVTDEWEPVFADLQPDMTHAEVESEIAKFEAKMEALRTAEPDKYKKGRDARNIPYKVVRGNLNEHQVLVNRNGRTYVMTINGNPRAAQALNGLTNPNVEMGGVIGNMLKLGEYVNRHLSAFYTTRNPDFVVSNFMRDMLYSNCMTWVKENPRYALRFHKNFGKVNPLTLRRLLSKWENYNLSDSNYLEKMFKEFMLNGGETGYTSVKDIEGHKRTIASELKKQGSTGRKAWSALGMQLDLLNRSAENCARFAAFLTSREMGRTLDRSIHDAKEVSVNFNKKGSGGKFVNATGQKFLGKLGSYLGGGGRIAYVFWNAGIQGMINFGRAGKRNPGKALGGAAALFTLGYVIPLLAQMLGGGDGDDDDKNAYYNLPEYVRRSNICFKAGEQWITIPLPIEYRAIYGMGELACGVISGNERYSNSELTRQMASQVSQVMPLDMLEGGGGISPFIPSAFKPMTEAYILNKGWTGLPVYKDTPYNKNDPEWTKAYQSADQHLVAFTRWLNETSGGNDYKKGAIDINPAKLEYLLSGTFGGAVSTTGKLKKMGETALGEREFEWRNMLLANRVIKSGDERTANRKLQNEYFKYLNEYEETNRLRKKYENAADDGILGYAERADFLYNSPEYLRFEIFEEYKPDIDAIREEIKGETDSKAKKELQNELFATMRELVDELHNVDK